MKALGIHVFAGGFTKGVKAAGFDVIAQYESHGFGIETAERVFGVPVVNSPASDWPEETCEFCYGNPRCTGFSCVTGGYSEDAHGPWSAPTQDIHDLCEFAVGKADCIVWESVQQAFTTGRPLLDYLRDEIFAPAGYRIAHLKINAASFGNAQQRKRYFFVAYRDDRTFNIEPPKISPYLPVTFDVIGHLRNEPVGDAVSLGEVFGPNDYTRLTDLENHVVPLIPNGWDLNMVVPYLFDDMPEIIQDKWELRTSPMPFSMHCIGRTNWLRPFPTITSSVHRRLHPEQHRTFTLREIALLMGWGDDLPLGRQQFAQIAKGVVPDVAEWLATQVKHYLNGVWGDEDYELTYCEKRGEWVGGDATGKTEKTIDLTRYVGRDFDIERYPDDTHIQRHRLNVDSSTGRLIRPWSAIEQSYRTHKGADGLRGPSFGSYEKLAGQH